MQVPNRKSESLRQTGRQTDHHLTRTAISKLERQLTRLTNDDRPQAVSDLTAAREMGDLSENAAYTEAKSRLRSIDNRILSIKNRLKNAVVIEGGPTADGRIRIGSRVKLSVNGREREYEILGSQESRPAAGRISYSSPLGAALMNRRAGETVTVTTADRELDYEIIEVS
jgi:transcription elongation factor GreA